MAQSQCFCYLGSESIGISFQAELNRPLPFLLVGQVVRTVIAVAVVAKLSIGEALTVELEALWLCTVAGFSWLYARRFEDIGLGFRNFCLDRRGHRRRRSARHLNDLFDIIGVRLSLPFWLWFLHTRFGGICSVGVIDEVDGGPNLIVSVLEGKIMRWAFWILGSEDTLEAGSEIRTTFEPEGDGVMVAARGRIGVAPPDGPDLRVIICVLPEVPEGVCCSLT